MWGLMKSFERVVQNEQSEDDSKEDEVKDDADLNPKDSVDKNGGKSRSN